MPRPLASVRKIRGAVLANWSGSAASRTQRTPWQLCVARASYWQAFSISRSVVTRSTKLLWHRQKGTPRAVGRSAIRFWIYPVLECAYHSHRTAPYRTAPHWIEAYRTEPNCAISGTLVVRSRYARGTLEVRSKFAISTVRVRYGCGTGAVRVRYGTLTFLWLILYIYIYIFF